MNWTKLSRTTTVRISLIYLALFLTSFFALGVGVYFFTARTLRAQLQETLVTTLSQLEQVYKGEGTHELEEEIRERENVTVWNAPDFALIDKTGRRIAGALPKYDYKPGIQFVTGPPESDNLTENQSIYADAVILSGGYILVVGEDADYIEDFGETLMAAFAWSGILVIGLGTLIGSLVSKSFLTKAETIIISAQKIIAGDVSHRLSISTSGDELDELAIVINRMLDRINKLVNDVSQVSNDVAHDLRTPISRLRQRLEETQRQSLSEDQYRDKIGEAISELDKILATFSAILRIAQIEAGARRRDFTSVEAGQMSSHVVDALLPVADESGKTLSIQIKDNISIYGDRELLTQLVFNLTENAIRHTPLGSHIGVLLEKKEGSFEIVVSDDGPGIPTDQRDKVFKRFYRLEKSRSTPGNGLGLSIVKAIADLHEAIIVLSDNRPGLHVSVQFPLPSDSSHH
jgi:signal transduction histidine kinase